MLLGLNEMMTGCQFVLWAVSLSLGWCRGSLMMEKNPRNWIVPGFMDVYYGILGLCAILQEVYL